jgi:predicted Zn-dependent protease
MPFFPQFRAKNAFWSVVVLLAFFAGRGRFSQATSSGFDSVASAANKAREAGRNTEAIQLYKRSVELKPDWAEGWWYLGTLQYDANQFAAAIPAFRTLTKLGPQASAAWNFLGLCEFETADYDSAKIDLERGLGAEQTDEEDLRRVARYHLALLRNRSGEFEKSTELLTKEFSTGTFPKDAKFALGLAALHVGLLPKDIDPSKEALISEVGEASALLVESRTQDAIRAFDGASAKYPETPFLNYAYGSALLAAGDQGGALARFRRELTVVPQNAQARVAIGRIEATLGKSDGGPQLHAAEEPQASTDSPDLQIMKFYARTTSGGANTSKQNTAATDDALWKLAMLDFSRGNFAESLATLKSWTAHNPSSGTAWAVMGLCEFALKDYDNSLIHLERGEQLGLNASPESQRAARYHHAMLLSRARQFQKASQVLANQAEDLASDKQLQFVLGLASLHIAKLPTEVASSQNSVVARTGEAVAALYQSKYDLGIPKLKQLIADYPQMPMLHFIYGKAFSALSNYDEAAEQFALETKISPQDPAPLVDLALTRLQQRRASDALASAQHAAELGPDLAEAHYALGRVYLELKQVDAAVSQLEIAARLAPASPEVHFNLAKAYARQNQAEKAAAERAIFRRLNALAEQQRSGRGNQAYGATRAEDTLSSAPPINGQASPQNQN